MDKTVLRNFAIESRKDLMERIERKIKLFCVDEEFKKDNRGDVIVLSNDKHTLTLTKEEDNNRDKLIKRIVELGYDKVVEESAYTWFNRLIALRYMEIHDYLPLTKENQSLGIRIMSSNENTPNPEILKFTNLTNKELDINFDKDIYNSKATEDDKYKYILLLICKKISISIPQIFGGSTDYIDLLIPDNMLKENGFIYNLLTKIDVSNFNEVEIIGWLYQFYNQVEKDRVIGSGKTYKKDEIAYATQLFTPDWIVKYMVENSLGRFWIEHGGDNSLIKNWKYFINNNIKKKNTISPESISFIDPCSGSGHILVYAFEVLYQIYESSGYSKKEIVEKILKNNINGLDIDDRASQLSVLSVLLKAREFDKDIFNKSICRELNIISINESDKLDDFSIDALPDDIKNTANEIKARFINAKEIGSLLKVEKNNYDNLLNYLNKENNITNLIIKEPIEKFVRQNEILTKQYSIVVTNPPYLNNSVMSDSMKEYLQKYYQIAKTDLFSCFIKRCNEWIVPDGYSALVTMQSWMFLPSFSDFRRYILDDYNINSLVYMDNNVMGIAFGTAAAIFENKNDLDSSPEGVYYEIKYKDLNNNIPTEFPVKGNKNIITTMKKFERLPNYNFSYWLDEDIVSLFDGKNLSDYAEAKQGLATGCNDIFMRSWYEVDYNNIKFNSKNHEEALESQKKWFPYNKGGSCIKWYGNNDFIVNWENDGYEIKHFYNDKGKLRSRPQNLEYYFRESITWSLTNSVRFGVRYKEQGHIFDVNGMSLFVNNPKYNKYIMSFLNSNVAFALLKTINPTMANQSGDILKLPIIIDESYIEEINKIAEENIKLARDNWNQSETSWDYKGNEIVAKSKGILKKYVEEFKSEQEKLFLKLKNNEERINEIFIKIYKYEKYMSSSIDENEISFKLLSPKEIIKELISYSVGCMFGRYTPYKEGLICAGNKFLINDYKDYYPDSDNIIPISDDESVYYNDDIVGKFLQFINIIFGSENFNDNLDYIAEILGKKGTESNEDTIRRYFINDFYNDHLKMYQKKPIYWLFDSGNKNGFKCLVYLHRYNEQIVSKIRTKYLHNTISVYQRIEDEINYKLSNEELNTTDKRNLQNQKSIISSKILECNQYDEMVGNVANKMIKLNLDDGIMNNYSKFVDDNCKSILARNK